MVLKPQDLMVTLKLAVLEGTWQSFSVFGHELGISGSEVHAAVQRGLEARLLLPGRKVNRSAVLEFILHGVPYCYYAERGPVTRGMPTAHAAPPLAGEIAGDDLPPVWPDPEGTVRGETLEPLHRSAPQAARRDARLYELLALVDAVRIGRARERKLAERHLTRMLQP